MSHLYSICMRIVYWRLDFNSLMYDFSRVQYLNYSHCKLNVYMSKLLNINTLHYIT